METLTTEFDNDLSLPGNKANTPAVTSGDDIRQLKKRTELLAPAGKWDSLEAVLEAGADAVYVSGKRFQMRSHRKDFNFDDDLLTDAVKLVHDQKKRIYVTVNALLGEHELQDCRRFLEFLEHLSVDGIIVCDLATLHISRELGLSCELHGSTMMNVHDVQQARVLRNLGLNRVVTSRDIGIEAAGRLGTLSGLSVEYFLHGDMCVAQSGGCSLSGIAFGKSSNRGECMKPCRWKYDLLRSGETGEPLAQGHLMAIRDLSLVRHIPELVNAGICALKIEGRMRDAEYLSGIVRIYRTMLDRYYAWPQGYQVSPQENEALYKLRVRELSSLSASGAPSSMSFFDISGIREPLMISNGLVERDMPASFSPSRDNSRKENIRLSTVPKLAVTVASPFAAREALEAGADRIYLAAETSQYGGQNWTDESIREAVALVRDAGALLGIHTPQISSARNEAEWITLKSLCPNPDMVLVHHLGSLLMARTYFPSASIIADTGFNILNGLAAKVLANQGACQITPSLEAGFSDLTALAQSGCPGMEIFAHGPITGMLLEHCIIAMNLTRGGSRDVCRSLCGRAEFSLRDQKNEVRRIMTDQYCRNHLLTARDLAILPHIEVFLGLNPASLRIDGRLYEPPLLGRITRAYRLRLDAHPDAGPLETADDSWKTLADASPRPWNLGAYAQTVTRSVSTLETKKATR